MVLRSGARNNLSVVESTPRITFNVLSRTNKTNNNSESNVDVTLVKFLSLNDLKVNNLFFDIQFFVGYQFKYAY